MSPTLIQQFATSTMQGMLGRARALSGLDHRLLKGELRELLVSEVLKSFLCHPFEVGSGIVVNQRGLQSRQTDIVIYDTTILPPFVKAQQMGVYPAECVLATIEVKSDLCAKGLSSAEIAAKELHEDVYSAKGSIYPDDHRFKPICAVFGFSGSGPEELTAQQPGQEWLSRECPHLCLLALAGKYSWFHLSRGWLFEPEGIETCEEVKRFVALLLDNVRTLSRARSDVTAESSAPKREERYAHRDWLSSYIRVQKLFPD